MSTEDFSHHPPSFDPAPHLLCEEEDVEFGVMVMPAAWVAPICKVSVKQKDEE